MYACCSVDMCLHLNTYVSRYMFFACLCYLLHAPASELHSQLVHGIDWLIDDINFSLLVFCANQ